MPVEAKKVVTVVYEVKNTQGEVVEKADDKEPMSYLHGAGNILPKIEEALTGKDVGDQIELTLEPADAYGEIQTEGNIQRIPAKYVGGSKGLRPGDQVTLQLKDGTLQTVTVKKVGKFSVDVDVNHPLAGQTLTFSVTIKDIRDATEEEVEHGHAHGPDGHHHHH